MIVLISLFKIGCMLSFECVVKWFIKYKIFIMINNLILVFIRFLIVKNVKIKLNDLLKDFLVVNFWFEINMEK